jgi:S1/P1 Nuclease
MPFVFSPVVLRQPTDESQVWDGHIIYADAGVSHPFSNLSIAPFFESLLYRIYFDDDFLEPVASWVSCINPTHPTICALSWALDSNKWTCEYVYKHQFNGTDLLDGGYAKGAFPIVEMQVSKAALRLATWLNRLVMDDFFPEEFEPKVEDAADAPNLEL